MNKDWKVLLDRKIINYIIGDENVISNWMEELKMPYMTGYSICDFGNKLGMNISYNGNKASRWVIMVEVIKYAIDNDAVSSFFKELLELKRFKNVESNYYSNPMELYWDLVNGIMIKINNVLLYNKCHIDYNFDSWQFNLIDDETEIKIESEMIKKIDVAYIKRLSNEIYKVIDEGDFESCITKSRTILEEIMEYGITQKSEEVKEFKGNINKLYSQFKSLYNMHQDANQDNRINSLLSGLEKVISAISDMRNLNSDSHGAGQKRISINKNHAILFANSAITMADFLLAVVDNNRS